MIIEILLKIAFHLAVNINYRTSHNKCSSTKLHVRWNQLGNRISRKYLPGELTCRFPALIICRVHRPSAFSPQKCTLRKGQSSKLELRTSRGRSNNNVDVVPIGEVSKSLKFPRGKNLRETCFTMGNLYFVDLRLIFTKIATQRKWAISENRCCYFSNLCVQSKKKGWQN